MHRPRALGRIAGIVVGRGIAVAIGMMMPPPLGETTTAWDVRHSGMLARVSGDLDLLAEVIELFLEDCPTMIENMRRALLEGDAGAVGMAAHSLMGSAGNFDATAVVTQARTVEAHALARDLPAARDAFVQLEIKTSELLERLVATLELL